MGGKRNSRVVRVFLDTLPIKRKREGEGRRERSSLVTPFLPLAKKEPKVFNCWCGEGRKKKRDRGMEVAAASSVVVVGWEVSLGGEEGRK